MILIFTRVILLLKEVIQVTDFDDLAEKIDRFYDSYKVLKRKTQLEEVLKDVNPKIAEVIREIVSELNYFALAQV